MSGSINDSRRFSKCSTARRAERESRAAAAAHRAAVLGRDRAQRLAELRAAHGRAAVTSAAHGLELRARVARPRRSYLAALVEWRNCMTEEADALLHSSKATYKLLKACLTNTVLAG
ncbi:MAG: hypothetical protein VXY81_04810, partial [Pseudomonadota bacterium]|nr:hypothetical protein [Pseudomonadota bacterium]